MSRLIHRLALAWLPAIALSASAAAPDVRLYTLDCGRGELADFGVASDTGEFDGQPHVMADPCFLIRHERGWLLWDAGMPTHLPARLGGGVPEDETLRRLGFRTWVVRPLVDQLADLGLGPDDIGTIAFSHLHFDHVGQADLFPHATWILDRQEFAWARAEPAHVSMAPELLDVSATAHVTWIAGDHDVFGDGSVRILAAPGHTPGSGVLLVRLPHHGTVLLSGDLYLTRESRRERLVPLVNENRAATLASMDRVERIVRRLHARVIVQHDLRDFEALPRPPRFLD